jgi:hypothetical protein
MYDLCFQEVVNAQVFSLYVRKDKFDAAGRRLEDLVRTHSAWLPLPAELHELLHEEPVQERASCKARAARALPAKTYVSDKPEEELRGMGKTLQPRYEGHIMEHATEDGEEFDYCTISTTTSAAQSVTR